MLRIDYTWYIIVALARAAGDICFVNDLYDVRIFFSDKVDTNIEVRRHSRYSLGDYVLQRVFKALNLLKRAEDFIFLEFFIIDEGTMWGRVLKILEEKVHEGVEVRVMYDGTCALFRLPYGYPKMLRKLGIQCKMFSPIRPMISAHYNNRDHRKIMVVDGRVAYTGGVNLSDEYVNRLQRFGHWKDVSLRLESAAVRDFTLMFLRMYSMSSSEPNAAACVIAFTL